MRRMLFLGVIILSLFLLQAPGCLMVLSINISPQSGPPGTVFEMSGSGFTENNTVTLHIQKPDGTEYSTIGAQTDGSGAYVQTWTSPMNSPTGEYSHWAIDDATGAMSGIVKFTITPGSTSNIVISQNQGFDKCEIASTSQLQTWWNSSPYRDVNIYVGGSARACANSGLNSSWINTVRAQGWNFIPTWVGPQAPCSGYSSRFSSDPNTAFNQGRSQADSAFQAMANLGLTTESGGTIVYYDMEAYNTGDSACKAAVEAGLSGWVSRLRELGNRAGIYGSGCGSAPTGWASMSHVPDDVWLAHWIYSSYNANATVWDVACVSNSLWSDHQRLRQYAGGHNETWGGITLNIDCNIADGHVATKNQSVTAQRVHPSNTEMLDPLQNQNQRLTFLSETQGWIQSDQQLWWTQDGGLNWNDITPMLENEAIIHASLFLNVNEGWLAAVSPLSPYEIQFFHTQNGGRDWNRMPFSLSEEEILSDIGSVYLHFVDSVTGFVVIKKASNSNFSLGVMFKTEDAGHSWQPLSIPIGEPVFFIDENIGWIAGGAAGDEFYMTQDGGKHWIRQAIEIPNQPRQVFYSLPTFKNKEEGRLAITFKDDVKAGIVFYQTLDRGKTWNLEATMDLDVAPADVSGYIPIAWKRLNDWIIAKSDRLDGVQIQNRKVSLMSDASIAFPPMFDSVKPSIVKMDFIDEDTGWIEMVSGQCRGYKPKAGESTEFITQDPFTCQHATVFHKTTDGGKTWRQMDMP